MALPSSPGERRGVDGLADDLAKQVSITQGDCPSYTRVLTALRELVDGPFADAELVAHLDRCWQGRLFTAAYERPLLMCAALRHEAILEGARHPLFTAIAAVNPDPEIATRDRVAASLSGDRIGLWITLTARRVQTNEVTRGVVWRWPAWLAGCDAARRPLVLVDIGASAGLNLISDRLAMTWTDAVGRVLPVASRIDCRGRIGFDTNPIDVRFEDDVTWLRACIWPGDHQRLARFDDAVIAMRDAYADAAEAPELHALQAGLVPHRLDALTKRLDSGTFVLAYQTFVRGYLEPSRQEAYVRGMRAWLASLAPGRAVWIECEMGDGGDPQFPAQMVAHANVAGGVRALPIARCGYHPRTVKVDTAAAEELRRALQR